MKLVFSGSYCYQLFRPVPAVLQQSPYWSLPPNFPSRQPSSVLCKGWIIKTSFLQIFSESSSFFRTTDFHRFLWLPARDFSTVNNLVENGRKQSLDASPFLNTDLHCCLFYIKKSWEPMQREWKAAGLWFCICESGFTAQFHWHLHLLVIPGEHTEHIQGNV